MDTAIAEPTVQDPSTDPYEMLIREARDLQRRHRRQRWAAMLVLILIVAVTVAVAGGGRSPSPGGAVNASTPSRSGTTASVPKYPPSIRGHVLSYAVTNAEGYDGDIAYGTPMKFPTMTIGVENPSPVSCVGERCFALGSTGAFDFPAISSNHGRTWRNGGHWFAGGWADSAAFPSRITTFSASVAVAWFPMLNTAFYTTSTAGRSWYSVIWPGKVRSVTASGASDVITVTIVGANSPRAATSSRYRSRDGGLVWTLDQ